MDLKTSRAVVTGADGFIGSHLAEMLVKEGCEVRALVQYNSQASWGWLDSSLYNSSMDIRLGDVRDSHFCETLVDGCDIVFNLAALVAIPYSYIAPDSYIDTNVKGAINICQAALHNESCRVVQMSTSEVYGTAQYVPIDEHHPLQPQSPYSASKIGADSIAMSFHNAFELEVVLARPFNTYGPRQSARAVIPTIISQIAAGNEVIKLGSLSPTRDFNYVEDTCRALTLLGPCDKAVGKVANIGSNFEVSIKDTALTIARLMNKDITIQTDDVRVRPKNSEVERLWCDNTLVRELCGYIPAYTFEEGLERTIAWFCDGDNLRLYKEDIYNV